MMERTPPRLIHAAKSLLRHYAMRVYRHDASDATEGYLYIPLVSRVADQIDGATRRMPNVGIGGAVGQDLFRHAIDVVVGLALGLKVGSVNVSKLCRSFVGLNANMKYCESGHHNLVSRHADNASRIG